MVFYECHVNDDNSDATITMLGSFAKLILIYAFYLYTITI